MTVSVVGAAAIIDYILPVERLPEPGDVVKVLGDGGCAKPYCGGCAPNIATGLAHLDIPTRLIYPVGFDFRGSRCEQYWQSLGLDLDGLCIQPELPSGVAYLFFQPGNETMCFSALGASNKAIPRPNVKLAETVVVSPVLENFTSFYLQRAVQENRNVVATGIVSQQLLDSLSAIQLLVINQREAQVLSSLAGGLQVHQLAQRYPQSWFFITGGSEGSQVFQGGHQYIIPTITPKQFVDPTGAGDAYTSGVIYAWLNGNDPDVCGYVGAACASFVIEAFGAQTNQPSFQKVLNRLERQTPEIVRRLERMDE
jgi:sugar/nucleoside kinase (ribokinase family)